MHTYIQAHNHKREPKANTSHQPLHLLGMLVDFLKLIANNLYNVLFNAHTYEGIIEGSSHFGWLDSTHSAGA